MAKMYGQRPCTFFPEITNPLQQLLFDQKIIEIGLEEEAEQVKHNARHEKRHMQRHGR